MAQVLLPQSFIRKCNEHVRCFPGQGLYYAHDLKDHLDHQKTFSFTGKYVVDLVILAPCSKYHHENPEFFVKDCLSGILRLKRNIVVLPSCCSDYSDATKEKIRAIDKGINWIFPENVPNFGNNDMMFFEIARYLISIRMIAMD